MTLSAQKHDIAWLASDHDQIEALVGDLAAILDDRELERAQQLYPDLAAALARHIRAEEDVLFPELEALPELAVACAGIRSEHRRIELDLAAVGDALGRNAVGDARFALGRLERNLSEHEAKEERLFYRKKGVSASSTNSGSASS